MQEWYAALSREEAKKPDTKPTGIHYVYVNGKPMVEKGRYVGGKYGVVVLKQK